MNHGAVGHDFSVNESTVCSKRIVFKQKHMENHVMYLPVDQNVVTRGSQEPDYRFPLGTTAVYSPIQ